MATPSSTTEPVVVATGTRLLSIVTPFVQPEDRDCDINDLTTLTNVQGVNDTTITTQIILSDGNDARFTPCQPSGWESVVPESRFTFSPGVCPTRWKALHMLMSTLSGKSVTTAFCCQTHYSLEYLLGTRGALCVQTISTYPSTTIQATLSQGTGKTQAVSEGLLVHTPWNIIWEASDQATMTPRPPDMQWGTSIDEWPAVETTKTISTIYTTSPSVNDASGLRQLANAFYLFFVIGLPLIALAIASCCLCCYRSRRKKVKKMQQQVLMQRAELSRAGLPATVPTVSNVPPEK